MGYYLSRQRCGSGSITSAAAASAICDVSDAGVDEDGDEAADDYADVIIVII